MADGDMGIESKIAAMGPRLYRYFYAAHGKLQAEDLVQETLLRVLRAFLEGHFDSNRGSLAMWIYGFARKVKLEHSRRHLRLVTEVELDDESLLDGKADPEDRVFEKQRLRRAISKLPELQQEVVLLWMDEELTLEEISFELGAPLNTIKSHLHRAKDNLKRMLSVETAKETL